MVTLRAVSNPVQCLKYALPLLKIGGIAILYRGHWSEEEQAELEAVGEDLGAKIDNIVAMQTPISQSVRHWIYLQKFDIPRRLKIFPAKNNL